MTECIYCGDALISFVEQLEDDTNLYLTVCPTCYRYISVNGRIVFGSVIESLLKY